MSSPSLDEILAVRDGSLAVVRQYNEDWFLIFQDGRGFCLPSGEEHADYLLAKCGNFNYGIAGWNGTYWGLNPAPILNEHEVRVVERLTGDEGDGVIAALLHQAENGT